MTLLCLAMVFAFSIVGTLRAAGPIPARVRQLVAQQVSEGDSVGIVVGVVDAQGDEFFSQGHFSSTDMLSLSAVQRTRPATGHDDGRPVAG